MFAWVPAMCIFITLGYVDVHVLSCCQPGQDPVCCRHEGVNEILIGRSVMMYLRSQDVLHVVFILHSGGPVHFDLLFGLLLGLGFSKLYPQRHDVGMLCVTVTI